MASHLLVSKLDLVFSSAPSDRLLQLHSLLHPFLTPSVSIHLVLSAYHLMAGLLLGVVKYHQIHTSKTFTAHPYISTAHRASLMYGFASFQLAGIACLSSFSERTNVQATVVTQTFFVAAVLTYAIHGFLKDTTNQLKTPHKLGTRGAVMPEWLVKLFMSSLIVAEVGGCGVLSAGMLKTVFAFFNNMI